MPRDLRLYRENEEHLPNARKEDISTRFNFTKLRMCQKPRFSSKSKDKQKSGSYPISPNAIFSLDDMIQ